MRARRLETVVQYVADPEASTACYARVLDADRTDYIAPYFRFSEHAYPILAQSARGTGRGGSGVWFEVERVGDAYRELSGEGFRFNETPYDIPPGKLVTLNEPDGNSVGFIDNSKGGMPGQAPG